MTDIVDRLRRAAATASDDAAAEPGGGTRRRVRERTSAILDAVREIESLRKELADRRIPAVEDRAMQDAVLLGIYYDMDGSVLEERPDEAEWLEAIRRNSPEHVADAEAVVLRMRGIGWR